MYKFIFTKKSEKDFNKIICSDKNRIIDKLKIIKKSSNINSYLRIVYNLLPATHRMRVGNYRLLIKLEGNNLIILKVGHRRDIYK